MLGIATSIACAIHCALLPLIIGTLPLFGVDIIHNVAFEWGMIALAFAVGAYSLYHGFMKHHRSYTPFYLFSAGILFLISKQIFPSAEYVLLAFAVLLIIAAHFLNFYYCHKSKVCNSPHHKH